jgi:hypothetical protein
VGPSGSLAGGHGCGAGDWCGAGAAHSAEPDWDWQLLREYAKTVERVDSTGRAGRPREGGENCDGDRPKVRK